MSWVIDNNGSLDDVMKTIDGGLLDLQCNGLGNNSMYNFELNFEIIF